MNKSKDRKKTWIMVFRIKIDILIYTIRFSARKLDIIINTIDIAFVK